MRKTSLFIGRQLSVKSQLWLSEIKAEYFAKPLIKVDLKEPEDFFFYKHETIAKNWVITSSYAAHWLVLYKDSVGIKPDDIIFCLSEKQEKILKPLGNNVVTSVQVNAESLAELVVRLTGYSKPIYLYGSHSLNTIPNVFDRHKLTWDGTQVYQNLPVKVTLQDTYDAYLFFSPTGIESFLAAGNSISYESSIYTIGEMTGKAAKEEFPNKVFVSPFQEEFAFISYALNHLKKSEHAQTKEPVFIY